MKSTTNLNTTAIGVFPAYAIFRISVKEKENDMFYDISTLSDSIKF
jgi:hypothetical protein